MAKILNRDLVVGGKISIRAEDGSDKEIVNKDGKIVGEQKGITSLMMSFETGELTATKIFFPYKVTINKIRGIVMKAVAGTDNGTITGANSVGNSTGGVITATASDALNTEYSVTPSTNNVVNTDSFYTLTSAKTTAGGRVLATIEYTRTV